jgi:hypothetical protein
VSEAQNGKSFSEKENKGRFNIKDKQKYRKTMSLRRKSTGKGMGGGGGLNLVFIVQEQYFLTGQTTTLLLEKGCCYFHT